MPTNFSQLFWHVNTFITSFFGFFFCQNKFFLDLLAQGDVFLDSDKTFGWYENKGSSSSADFELSFIQIPGMVLSDWFCLSSSPYLEIPEVFSLRDVCE